MIQPITKAILALFLLLSPHISAAPLTPRGSPCENTVKPHIVSLAIDDVMHGYTQTITTATDCCVLLDASLILKVSSFNTGTSTCKFYTTADCTGMGVQSTGLNEGHAPPPGSVSTTPSIALSEGHTPVPGTVQPAVWNDSFQTFMCSA